MARAERQALIQKLQAVRDGRLLIAYVTSTRPGHEIQMADDVLRLLYEHLAAGRDAAKKGVDLFIHSNGGSGTVPWRIVSLIREYTGNLAVLVPHHAFSAATLTALGADEIVMHRMGCLGPIDPSVANIFNPVHPHNPSMPAPISVEDVTAYFKLVKDEVGITHEDELVQALGALTEKIHPLALGNVQRSHNQSRMMARKLLKKHMAADHEHEMEQIIDNLKSNLFFHGHPISRREANDDLKLKIKEPPPPVEALMWDLYLEYEDALNLRQPFSPLHELECVRGSEAAPAPITTQQIARQLQQMAQNGLPLAPGAEKLLVELAVAMLPHVQGRTTPAKLTLDGMPGAYAESFGRTDVFKTDLSVERATMLTPAGPQEGIKQEVRWQRWEMET
jgi:hypothetical protein